MVNGADPLASQPEPGAHQGAAETGSAGWFEDGGQPLFGVLHRPVGRPAASIGVVLVSPFGWPELYSHRSRRYWAIRLARAGFTTLRYDLPGSGDSFGSVGDPGRFDAWVSSVGAAVRFLRRDPAVGRVAVFGIELGGLIAAQSLAQGTDIDDLLLWGTPTKGRALLRGMSAQAAIATSQFAEDRADEDLHGGLDLAGFYLNPELRAAIEAIDLSAVDLPARPGGRVLILNSGDRSDASLRARFADAGMEVDTEAGKDFSDLMTAPQDPLLRRPEATIAHSILWLEGAPARMTPPTTGAPPQVQLSASAEAGGITEVLVPVQVEGQITEVVLTQPTARPRAGTLAVLLCPGAIRRVGLHRMSVEIARRWADLGVASVRFDLTAIGDARGPEDDGIDERPLISVSALLSAPTGGTVNRTIHHICQQLGFERFVGVGHCSGAYLAYQAALALDEAAGCIVVDLPMFSHSDDLYQAHMFSLLRQALRGGFVRRWRQKRLTRREFRWAWEAVKHRARSRGRGTPEQRHREAAVITLDRLAGRGTPVTLIAPRSNGALKVLSDPEFPEPSRWPALSIERIPSADPSYHALAMQRFVHDRADTALGGLLEAGGPEAPLAGQRSGV